MQGRGTRSKERSIKENHSHETNAFPHSHPHDAAVSRRLRQQGRRADRRRQRAFAGAGRRRGAVRRNDRTPDEPEQPEQTQPAEQEPADSKPEQTQPADNSKPKQEPAGEPEKEPAKQPEQKPEPKPAEKPAEGTSAEPPTETPKPETPAEDKPAAAVDDALTILNAIWNTYSDEEKFPAAGGDSEHAVDGAPGSFDVSNADSLSYQLTFPADDASLIDSAASLVHMMNLNTFTCGAFHVADANNVARLADDLRTTIQAKHWMCGFPDKLVVVTVGQSVFSVYGNRGAGQHLPR